MMSKIGRNELCPCGSRRKFKHCHGSAVTDRALAAAPIDANDTSLFGPAAARSVFLLNSFAKAAQPCHYRIMPLAESAEIKEIGQRNEVYWQEILYRAHFGACAGLMRLHEWLTGSQKAFDDGNILMMAAGIRGLLEASADTFRVFSDVAPTLADAHVVVRQAINGTLSEQLALAPELESSLIHFAYARGIKPGESIALHKAATAKEDISSLLEVAPKALAVYALLCDYSHPGAASVFRFAGERPTPDMLTFDPTAGPVTIREITEQSREVGPAALYLGVGTLLVTLKTLNAFSFAPVKTPWADGVDLRFLPIWVDLEKRIADSRTTAKMASAEERERLIAELMAQYEPFGKGKPRKKR